MELKFIDYLFEKGYLDMDEIIKKNIDNNMDNTTIKLFKKIVN
jgi:hypothetical protein